MSNPWLARQNLHFAHQGGALEAPSSTLHAMRRAVDECGAQALELDVHRSADGHLVVCHDETVDRTTPHVGRIHEFTLDQLLSFDNAYWWAPGFEATTELNDHQYLYRGRFPDDRSFGIATLDAVLREFPDTFLNFDIKEIGPVRYERQLADSLRAYGRSTNVIVASFHDDALREFASYAPDIHVSLGPHDTFAFYAAVNEGGTMPRFSSSQVALQIPPSFEGIEVISGPFVEAAHRIGLAVHAWTIDDANEMHRLFDLGVDGIMTDRPSVLSAVLLARREQLIDRSEVVAQDRA